MEREFIGQIATLGHLDGVDLADEISDRSIGSGQLLPEAILTMHPVDGCIVAPFGDEIAGVLGNRVIGIVVDLGTGDDGHPFVEQSGERTDHAGLGLTAFAEEDDVMTGEQCVLELRQHGVLIAEHVGEQRFTGPNAGDGVGPQLLLDRTAGPARGSQGTESCGTF